MKYLQNRSLGFNLAAKLKLDENEFREMMNAKTHIKSTLSDNGKGLISAYDVILNKDEDTVSILSMQKLIGYGKSDFMIVTLSLKEQNLTWDRFLELGLDNDCLAGNARYTSDAEKALLYLYNDIVGYTMPENPYYFCDTIHMKNMVKFMMGINLEDAKRKWNESALKALLDFRNYQNVDSYKKLSTFC